MATKQGMCKNCGSLILFDDTKDKCECVFCHCVFESEIALKIMANPDGYEFPNEVIPESEKGDTHYYVTPIYDDKVANAVKYDITTKNNVKKEITLSNDFEIKPSDVKAPKKLVIILSAVTLLFFLIAFGIAFPLYSQRGKFNKVLNSEMKTVFDDVMDVDCTYEDGGAVGYGLSGNKCQKLMAVTEDSINEDDAKKVFENFSKLHYDNSTGVNDKKLSVVIYSENGIFDVSSDGNVINVK